MSRAVPFLQPRWLIGLAALAAVPFVIRLLGLSEKYYLHLGIQILLWGFIYTGWALMARFGMTSLGHSAFTAIGAYGTVLLWNFANLTPLLGIPVAVAGAVALGLLVGYPCFRFRIAGHYFGLLTLALAEFVRVVVIGLRNWTGGSQGTQPRRYEDGISLYAVQFEPDRTLSYFIALAVWLVGVWIWLRVDSSMDRYALDAAAQDEDAAASVGIDVRREKLKVTAISAAMCGFGGALFAQYQMFVTPDTIGGVGIALQMAFAVIFGGVYTVIGPLFGAALTQLLTETLRVVVQSSDFLKNTLGSRALALDSVIYGILLVVFIIKMPKGVVGTLMERRR